LHKAKPYAARYLGDIRTQPVLARHSPRPFLTRCEAGPPQLNSGHLVDFAAWRPRPVVRQPEADQERHQAFDLEVDLEFAVFLIPWP
jgi:hypothetical protein